MLQIKNSGRSEEEARKFWGVTLARTALESLPADFSYRG
jgi:hypothetical protein